MLLFLAQRQGKILTKQQIYEAVWQEPYGYDDNNIMAVISRLRKKLEPDPAAPKYIQDHQRRRLPVQQGGVTAYDGHRLGGIGGGGRGAGLCRVHGFGARGASWPRWHRPSPTSAPATATAASWQTSTNRPRRLVFAVNEIVLGYEARIAALQKAEEANRQLMTSLSHDVRTPLTTLIGYLDAAHRGVLAGADRDASLETARRKAHELKDYIDALFDWFQLHSREAALRCEPVEGRRTDAGNPGPIGCRCLRSRGLPTTSTFRTGR